MLIRSHYSSRSLKCFQQGGQLGSLVYAGGFLPTVSLFFFTVFHWGVSMRFFTSLAAIFGVLVQSHLILPVSYEVPFVEASP